MKKPQKRLVAIILMVVGGGLIFWGYQKSGGLGSQLSNAFTGSHSDSVMMLFIGGGGCLVVGFFMKK